MTNAKPSRIRSTLAVVIGLLVAVTAIALAELAGHRIYPLPAGVDPTDEVAMRAFVASLPTGAFLVVLAGWAVGALVGGLVATLMVRRASERPAHVVGALLLVAAIANMMTIPHPTWFWIAAVLLFLPSAAIGARLAGRASA